MRHCYNMVYSVHSAVGPVCTAYVSQVCVHLWLSWGWKRIHHTYIWYLRRAITNTRYACVIIPMAQLLYHNMMCPSQCKKHILIQFWNCQNWNCRQIGTRHKQIFKPSLYNFSAHKNQTRLPSVQPKTINVTVRKHIIRLACHMRTHKPTRTHIIRNPLGKR